MCNKRSFFSKKINQVQFNVSVIASTATVDYIVGQFVQWNGLSTQFRSGIISRVSLTPRQIFVIAGPMQVVMQG